MSENIETEIKEKGIDLNSNILAGIISIFFLSIMFIGLFFAMSLGIWDILFIFFYAYVIHKTLYKHKKLTGLEWSIFIIFTFINSLLFLAGFIYGLVS